MKFIYSASLHLLLLSLSLSRADPLPEEDEDNEVDGQDDDDISTRILASNFDSDEFLLEGDVLASTSRNARKCMRHNCKWKKDKNGSVMVPYTVSRSFSSWHSQTIQSAMEIFHQKTCIRFVVRQDEQDYISIENRGGCYSAVGQHGGKQVLSLNQEGCLLPGIIQHELIHALGFWHEHTRSDRDTYVRINWNNIWTSNMHNFHKHDTNNLNTEYDYTSIMHYGKRAFSRNNSPTITPIPDNNVKIGQRTRLSNLDILKINRLYKCF